MRGRWNLVMQAISVSDLPDSSYPIKREKSLAEKVSRVSFFLYVIFVLVGTKPLFPDKVTNAQDVTTSNPINQVVDTLIPFISLLCLLPRRKSLLSLLKQEKCLTLFFIWCLLSILWSDFPFNSFKLWVRLFGSTTVVLALLLNLKSPDEALRYFKAVFALYIPITFLAIAFVPAATQWEWPAWRGIADHKNTLGQISFISTMVWAFAICKPSGKKRKYSWLFLFASLVLLVGSKSSTVLIVLFSLLLMALYLLVERRLQRLRVGRIVSLAMAGCLLILFYFGNAFELETVTGAVGKDTTFTGRSDLWEVILDEAKTHPYIGCGIGGFWIVENPLVQRLYQDDAFPWLPNEAHEGYLDLFNETGIVGMFLLTLMVISYFKNLSKLRKPHFWKWFLIGVLLLNLTESTLFRSASFSGWIFVFSYLALHVELMHSRGLVLERVWGRRPEMEEWLGTVAGARMAKRNEGSAL